MTKFVNVVAVVILISVLVRSDDDSCTCSDKNLCNPNNSWAATKKQVVVTTDLTSQYTDWLWHTLTTVLVVNKSIENQTDLMCYTHSQGKQYGFFLDVPQISETIDLNAFVNQSIQDVQTMHADVVALNFIKLVGDCSYSGHHVKAISDNAQHVFEGIQAIVPNLTILCVLPWKPPCYDSDCSITPTMAKLCDGLILNLDSFSTYCDESCTAKAIVPFTKLMMAIEEYVSMGFNVSQILLSVPWHGYKYKCTADTFMDGLEKNHICHLKSVTNGNQKVCQYEDVRSKVNLESLIKDHPELAHEEKTYSSADQSAWYTVKNKDNTSSQIWFEDIKSLERKYDIVNMFSLKGLVVYTADDLSYTHVKTEGQHDFDDFMWSWLVHEVFSSKTTQDIIEKDKTNYTGTAVGVGIGMFLIGVVGGVIISCVVFKYRSKKPYRPFTSDRDTEDYHDEF